MYVFDFNGFFELKLVFLELVKHFNEFGFELEHLKLVLCGLAIGLGRG